jgi:hypothetical protein
LFKAEKAAKDKNRYSSEEKKFNKSLVPVVVHLNGSVVRYLEKKKIVVVIEEQRQVASVWPYNIFRLVLTTRAEPTRPTLHSSIW